MDRKKKSKSGSSLGKRRNPRPLGFAGRNIFINRKRIREKAEKQTIFLLRGILSFVVVSVLTIFFVILFGYVVPFLQEEFSSGIAESSGGDLTSVYIEPETTYDDVGLPILGDEITLFVINSSNAASADDVPKTKQVGGIAVEEHTANALQKMMDAAADAGYMLNFTKGYVSFDRQKQLYEDEVQRRINLGETNVMARTNAKTAVPMAGTSDFQTGMCIQLEGDSETFQSSQTYLWLNTNMVKYGFVFRYPQGKQDETGQEPDLRVLRYVGSKNAERMRQLSMCLEEYIAYLNKQGS